MNNLVKDLCNKCENSICENHRGCAFRSLSNEYCDEVERLDLYINQLQQENQQLKEIIDQLNKHLKQRDEVIKDIKNIVTKYVDEKYAKINSVKQFSRYLELPIAINEVLNKHKGDSNGI